MGTGAATGLTIGVATGVVALESACEVYYGFPLTDTLTFGMSSSASASASVSAEAVAVAAGVVSPF